MKYSELEKKLKGMGCYLIRSEQGGHPLWYSPRTGKTFQMSHHGRKEVAAGTLRKIKRDAGLE
ncbi:MAG: type II toxin-antitoxin system HicA family toxin [Bacteroidales bacterium]|nr:type II toxin-antitoxin system HicA family toxin [Bacteroidales bacterium]